MSFKRIALIINLSLLGGAVLFTIALLEIILRIACPQYKYAAEADIRINQSRIFENTRNTRSTRQHPDTGKKHLVIHNSLGLRQHREFLREKPKDVIRIGFFGDSFTENLRMPSQYSFTEPLDYLLNKTGKKYEILNFGTDGYGTDQIYLQYMQEGVPLNLDFVFYVCFSNDLRNINETGLFKLGPKGNIRSKPAGRNPWIGFLNKLYITYFILDHNDRLKSYFDRKQEGQLKKGLAQRFHNARYEAVQDDFENGKITEDIRETCKLFLAILFDMKKLCEKNDAHFFIVTLPMKSQETMFDLLIKNGYFAVNLYRPFDVVSPDKKNYKFIHDDHWNEEGNKLAAIVLFKFLAKELNIEYPGDEFIEQSLYEYYGSFEPNIVTDYLLKKHKDLSGDLGDKIKFKYLALEQAN